MSSSHTKAKKSPVTDSQEDAKIEVNQAEDQFTNRTKLPHNSMKFRKPATRTRAGSKNTSTSDTDSDTYNISAVISYLALLTHLSIGAVNIVVLGYSIKAGETHKIHAVLCSAGWHLFTMEAVMAFAYQNTWSTLLKADRRILHYFLNSCGIIFVFCGAGIKMIHTGFSETFETLHGVFGALALITTIVTLLLGPITLLSTKKELWKCLHICFAIPTIILSAICLAIAILYTDFEKYCGEGVAMFLVIVISIYTFMLVIMIFIHALFE